MSSVAFDEQVAEQPTTVERLLELPGIPRLDQERPIVFTGIGTSLHACRVAATWVRRLTGGRLRPVALDAHDLSLTESVTARDQVVVVSHRGTKRYPNQVLSLATAAGAATVCITGEGAAQPAADIVLRTVHQERAGTHTVSYVGALTVLGRLVCGLLGTEAEELDLALRAAPEAMRATLEARLPGRAAEAIADSTPNPVLIAGTGLDAITAQEAALKFKEGTYRWVEGLHTEFALHGTPAVFSAATVSFLIRPAAPDGGRTDELAAYLGAVGATTLTVGAGMDCDLPFAQVPELARPLVAVLPFHRLVSAVAARVGASPDLIHQESEPWASAAKAVTL